MSDVPDFLAARGAYLGALDDVIALFRYRDAWRPENETLANDIAELVVGLTVERDALRAEVARLRPLRALLDAAGDRGITLFNEQRPPMWTLDVDGNCATGSLDFVIAAACDRLGVDHG